MSDQPQIVVENKKSGPMANIMAVLYLGGLLTIVVGGIWFGCNEHRDIHAAAEAYMEALRHKNIDAAYALLAPQTRAKRPRNSFAQTTASTRLARSTDHIWNKTSSSSNGQGCVNGAVSVDDEWSTVTFWMWKDGEQWTVHTVYVGAWDHGNVPWQCYSPP